jgi:hypothetical protein
MPPPVNDQWDSVFATPIPFLLALGFVAAGIWAAMLWRYKAVNEKTRELYELLTKKTDLANEMAIQTQAELTSTIAEQTKQIEDLKAQQNLSEETRAAVAGLARTSSIATNQLRTLDAANNAVSQAISDSHRLTTSWRSTGRRLLMKGITCPICGASAKEWFPTGGDFHDISCPTHDEFEVSGTAMTTRRGRASQDDWERALERAKLRAESGKRPRILDDDFR